MKHSNVRMDWSCDGNHRNGLKRYSVCLRTMRIYVPCEMRHTWAQKQPSEQHERRMAVNGGLWLDGGFFVRLDHKPAEPPLKFPYWLYAGMFIYSLLIPVMLFSINIIRNNIFICPIHFLLQITYKKETPRSGILFKNSALWDTLSEMLRSTSFCF